MSENIVRVIIEGSHEGMHKAVHGANEDLDKLGKASKIATGIVGGGMLALGAGAIAFAGESVKAANEFEESQQRLEVAIKNTKGNYEELKPAIDAARKSGENLGFNNTEVVQSLSIMTSGMGSAKKALENLHIAEDLSAKQGIPLAEAANLVTKAYLGQTKPLKALNIDLPIAKGGALALANANKQLMAAALNVQHVEQKIHDGRLKGKAAADALKTAHDKLNAAQAKVNMTTLTGQAILDSISKVMGGSAKKATEGLSGEQKVLAAKIHDTQIELGQKLQPALLKVETWMLKSGIPGIQSFAKEWSKEWTQMGADIDNWSHNVLRTYDSTLGKIGSDTGSVLADIGSAFGIGTGSGPVDKNAELARLHAYKRSLQGSKPGSTGARAAGGLVGAGGSYMVGEDGPEILQMGASGGRVTPSGGGGTTIIHFPAGAAPAAVQAAQARWNRRNGKSS